MAKSFGRDDMNALLGGSNAENGQESSSASLIFRPPSLQQKQRRRTDKDNEPDIASLTPAETAALLLDKNAKNAASASAGAASSSSTRYRTKKVLAHHELAKELLSSPIEETVRTTHRQDLNAYNYRKGNRDDAEQHEDDSENEFVSKRVSSVNKNKPKEPIAQQVASHRSKIEPQVISKQRKRRSYDSSSSSSSESGDSADRKRTRRRRPQGADDSSSSGSSSDEEDNRRKRLLEQRRRNRVEPEIVARKSSKCPSDSKGIENKKESKLSEYAAPEAALLQKQSQKPPKPAPEMKTRHSDNTGDSSSSSGDSSSDDSSSDSSSSSSSSSEEQVAIAKPLFVPKHKRRLLQSEDKKVEEEEARQQREEERVQKRIMESRGMVVAAVQAATAVAGAEEEEDEEAGGATNLPPNDDDDINREEERDLWEMRELERLLSALDQSKEREAERLEYERRRRMTDEEVLEEDNRNGRYQRPGSNRVPGEQSKEKHNQRFFHRGAYYQQADEWDESDVRHKAAEYARAATGDDKIDRSQLPEVMQVKNFGLARQNHKYKGLAKEDTTDRSMEILPIVRKREGER